MIIASKTEKLIMILLLPILFPLALCTWTIGVIASVFVWIFKWTYNGYGAEL